MDVERFLSELRASPKYAGQIAHVRCLPAREGRYATLSVPLASPVEQMLAARGIDRLYSHQAEALEALLATRENVLIATGPASGKSLCYIVPVLQSLCTDPEATALFLFPTKALTQDQFRSFDSALGQAGLEVVAGTYDGDTATNARRKLRDRASVIFSNPDMLHASVLSNHARWDGFLSHLRWLVLDELHVYSGMFGSNVANLLRRFFRVCQRYGSDPQVIACSATVANPQELAEAVVGKRFRLVDDDGSPRGKRTFVFWNPPRIRDTTYRSRRSANVEAHELMARLIQAGAPTITFSKAKMTAEMIYRYVCEKLASEAPGLVGKVAPYRGGYLPEERREIEQRLFSGELLGVSSTSALELGIDVGGLDACIIVGYPGTLASFLQQAGRAGRREREALVILVGLDTAVNQYVISHPEYLFERPIERSVTDRDNPFIILGHLRCAAHEIPLEPAEVEGFGPDAWVVVHVLQENGKLAELRGRLYHAATEVPQHEVSLRDYADGNVTIQDDDTGRVLGDVSKFDAQPLVHPGAIYMHLGDTYLVRELDLQRNIAHVRRVEVDYYTQPLGGTDVHHIDHSLREKPFGAGMVRWGEVTAYFNNPAYERVHFYSLDTLSVHPLQLPTWVLATMALWIEPPAELMDQVFRAGLNAHAGLRGIGYATRGLLPMFVTCQTLDFSHSVGAVNAPWHTIFIYERYPLGLGFTLQAYLRLHEIMPAVLAHVRACPCEDGCPVCVGKPLRGATTWNVERGEGSIPSKAAALMILEALLAPLAEQTPTAVTEPEAESRAEHDERLEQALRRRLERMRETEEFHFIEPQSEVTTTYPDPEPPETLGTPDVERRRQRRGEGGA